jgi:hypothetical protein
MDQVIRYDLSYLKVPVLMEPHQRQKRSLVLREPRTKKTTYLRVVKEPATKKTNYLRIIKEPATKKTNYLGVLKEPAVKVRMISNLLLHDHPVPKNKT